MIHIDNVADIYKKKNIVIWLISSFKAGFINSAGFLASGMFVSHVTGFGTQGGIAMGHEEYFFGLELMIIPVFFILGGVLTSLILDRKYIKNECPPYYLVQGLITLLLLVIIFIGGDEIFNSSKDYGFIEFAVIATLCLVCGLKNGLITWTTYGKIRVTHMTGLCTDLGLNLIHTFYPKQHNTRFKEARIVNITRVLTLGSFMSGAFISAILFPKIGYKGFLVVFFISFIMTIYSVSQVRIIDQKVKAL